MRLIDDENLDNCYCFFLALKRLKCYAANSDSDDFSVIYKDFWYLINESKMDLHHPTRNVFDFINTEEFRNELADFLDKGFDNWFNTRAWNQVLYNLENGEL